MSEDDFSQLPPSDEDFIDAQRLRRQKIAELEALSGEQPPDPPRNYPVNELNGWIGVDLDGTLAIETDIDGDVGIGEPVPEMAARVRRWHAAGMTVKIFTARASHPAEVPKIKAWLLAHKLPDLEVTNIKDHKMIELWDDRAVEVVANTGRPANLVRRMTSPTSL